MKSQDIVILLKLVSLNEQEKFQEISKIRNLPNHEDPYSVRGLEFSLGISKTEISASINRSISSGLAIKEHKSGRPKPNRRDLYNFIINGLKFVFPVQPGSITRGVATAFAAPMLINKLISAGDYNYVWPYAEGKEMGQAVKPLFRTVPEASKNDDLLYEYLALIDAMRLGNQREAGLARNLIEEKLMQK